jgi:hypothetical protein
MATVDWDGAKNCLVELATQQIRLFLAEKEPLDQICAFGLSLQNSDGYANLAADTIEFRERKYKEYCSTWKPISRTEWSARMGNWKYKGGIIRQEPNLDREWGPFAAQIAAANEDLFYEEDDDSELYNELEMDEEAADEFHRNYQERFSFPALEEIIRRDLFAPRTKELIYLVSDWDQMPAESLKVLGRFEDFKKSLP